MPRSAWRGCTPRGDAALDAMLGRIQNDLFDVGADLCLPEKGPGGARLTVTDAQVAWLESEIDTLNARTRAAALLRPARRHAAAAYLHLARTVCRRAERLMVELEDQPGENVSAPSLNYINRLSDFCSSPAATPTTKARGDVLWVPGQNR